MPAMPPVRHLKHTRSILLEAFAREDGLWDIEARLTDTKTRDIALASGVRAAGEPIHNMHLCITINTDFDVVDVVAHSLAVPYPGQCEAITPAYKKLIGLNLLRSFRAKVRERLGGIDGCTHLSELAAVVPTAAVQAFAGERAHLRSAEEKPFQLDHCHALRSDGDAVRQFYPRWYVDKRPQGEQRDSDTSSQPVAFQSKESHEDS
jgi:hypothetical protein